MPHWPEVRRFSGNTGGGTGKPTVAIFSNLSDEPTPGGSRPSARHSFVFPIRIVRMLHVPERPATVDGRHFLEVVRRRRRCRRPFQSPGLPWIVARRLAFPQRNHNVVGKNQKARRLNQCTEGS